MAFVLKVKSLGSKPQNWRKKGLFWAIFRSILGENMAFFAKSRRKLRTKNFEAHFHRKLRTLEKYSNVKKLRTAEPQSTFNGTSCLDLPELISLILKYFNKKSLQFYFTFSHSWNKYKIDYQYHSTPPTPSSIVNSHLKLIISSCS